MKKKFLTFCCIHSEVFNHIKPSETDLYFYFQKEYKLTGVYVGKEKGIHLFDTIYLKKDMLKQPDKIKNIILSEIHRKIKEVKFFENIVFKDMESEIMFYLFTNSDGYLEQKIINMEKKNE